MASGQDWFEEMKEAAVSVWNEGPDFIPDDDPRRRLSTRQFLGMRKLYLDHRPDDVVAELGVPLVLVKRWLVTPRFQRALRAQREAPLSPSASYRLAQGQGDRLTRTEEGPR